MDIADVIFSSYMPAQVKRAFLEIMIDEKITDQTIKIIRPTDTNDDFTYQDATEDEIYDATTLGYYKYFFNYGSNYTGHQYYGTGNPFEAIVINPPTRIRCNPHRITPLH